MRFTLLLLTVLASSLLTVDIVHAAKPNHKYASLVIDADTGSIISQRHSTKTLHPASLTKMMTMLLTFEAMDKGKVSKNTRIRISSRAASMVPSKLGLKAGSTIRIEDAIKSLATKSANDVAVALAEHLGGSESRFASAMTKRARTIGMKSTRFRNASGLHHPAQVSSARDMAKLARYILKRYPHHYKYFSTRSFTYKGKTYRNHNKLLESYPGADGFKTGYINASGFNLVASANQNGQRLIGVVFGGRSGKTRNAHMEELLNDGFKKVKSKRTAIKLNSAPPIPPQKPTYGIAKISHSTPKKVESYASLASLEAKNSSKKNDKNTAGPKQNLKKWAVQIGAYKSQNRTNEALRYAKEKLPTAFSYVTPLIVPLNTKQGTIYRARLGGMNKEQARKICDYFHDCVTIAPIATQISSK